MRRLAIPRISIAIRGVAPETAAAATRLLGHALAQALEERSVNATAQSRLDAGRISFDAEADPETLAARLARRIADKLSEG